MTLLRAVVHVGAVAMLTLVSACGAPYGGARCRAITLQTSPASLPLGNTVAVPADSFRQAEPFIVGTGELGCCVANPFFSARADCGAVDCEQLRQRLTVAHVGGEYEGEACGAQGTPFTPPQGAGTCNVYLDGDVIVGVRAYCSD